ncbi:MAG TPA: VanZ family protein [Clostridia bacterium]|nr:VanZ family protein [Clostridia bacterium]
MKEIALIGYGVLCTVIPAIALYLLLNARKRAKGLPETRHGFWMILLLSVYVAGVFYVTGTGTIYDVRQYGLSEMATQWSLVPFSAEEFDVVSYLLNIVLFVPLGFLLPLIWESENGFCKILLAGVLFSLLIECSQLLNLRSTDIDDLLLNTLGAVVGFALFRAYAWLSKRVKRTQTAPAWEVALYFCVMFFGHFLLYHEFGFAKILYGF